MTVTVPPKNALRKFALNALSMRTAPQNSVIRTIKNVYNVRAIKIVKIRITKYVMSYL
jgi:hypothetical protein